MCQEDRAFGMGQDVGTGTAQGCSDREWLPRRPMTMRSASHLSASLRMPISGVLTSWTVYPDAVWVFPERRPWLFQDVARLILGQFGQVLDFSSVMSSKTIEAVQDGIGIGDIDDGQFGTIWSA